jgi:hypothetical protein
MARYCFADDLEYQARVHRDKTEFDTNFLEFCMTPGDNVETFIVPVHSVNPNDPLFCGHANVLSARSLAAALSVVAIAAHLIWM